MSGMRPPELDLPVEPPNNLVWIWNVFHDIAAGRQYIDVLHPQRLSNYEVQAWCDLTGEKLSKRELAVIRLMDATWINSRTMLAKDLMDNG